jgi:hypothetical protein
LSIMMFFVIAAITIAVNSICRCFSLSTAILIPDERERHV